MSFRLVPTSVTMNDLERRNAVILRYSTEFGSFKGQLRKSGRKWSHSVCDKIPKKNLVFSNIYNIRQYSQRFLRTNSLVRGATCQMR